MNKRQEILTFIHENGGEATKKEIVDKYGNWYYYNGSKHLGDILSRLVNNGNLVRVKKGCYKLGKGLGAVQMISENQTELFK